MWKQRNVKVYLDSATGYKVFMEKNLITGSVWKYFSLPFLFSYFLQLLYGRADLFITGQFNTTNSITLYRLKVRYAYALFHLALWAWLWYGNNCRTWHKTEHFLFNYKKGVLLLENFVEFIQNGCIIKCGWIGNLVFLIHGEGL